MNIESANLSPLASSSGTVASSGAVAGMSPPLADEGFSGALVTQIELLSNIKTGDALSLQASDQDVNGLPVVAGLSVGKSDTQDFAALLGNDLPPTYKTKDDVDHEAALGAVTDTLKYIAMGTTAGEKAAEAEQNIKDVIAMAVPVEQSIKDVVDVVTVAAPVQQNVKDVVTVAAPVQQNVKDVVTVAAPVQQNAKDVVTVAVPVQQNTTEAGAEVEQGMKDVVGMNVPGQMDLKPTNDKPDKAQADGEVSKEVNKEVNKIAGEEDKHAAEGGVEAVILPTVMPAEQARIVNNLTPADIIKEDGLLSFIKPSIGAAKSDQSAKVAGDVLQSEAVFRQPVQDKQSFNLKYFDNTGKVENTRQQQVLSLDGEKTLPRVGADITQLNRPVVDNKTDVPAMTKPLSHPEWNKDLGERIVWMNNRAIPSAEIRLNPQHLGPISVRVDVADDQATVVFTAQHAAVRDALEASIPKLREMMSSQQINLVDVNVYQGHSSDSGRSQSQNFAQGFADSQRQGGSGSRAAVDGMDEVEQEIESGRAVVSKGLLSIYA